MYTINVVLITALIVNYINISNSQSPCVTPNGENGNCILFESCEPFTKIFKNRTSVNIAFFRKSHCGFQENKALVCCGSVAEMKDMKNVNVNTEKVTTENLIPKSVTTITTPSNPVRLKPVTVNPLTSNPITMNPITINPITINSITVNPITMNPITSNSVTSTPVPLPVSIPFSQLFTSAIVTNTPPTNQEVVTNTPSTTLIDTPNRSGFGSHPNFNLLPPPGQCGFQTTGVKITNGNETDLDEYPWLAMLLYREAGRTLPNCGGSLINTKYVLTAAHCIKGNLLAVRLGEYDIDMEKDCIFQEGEEVCADPYQQFGIEDMQRHPRHSNMDNNRHHDIGLIRLKGEAKITDFVKPICLPLNNERTKPGGNLTVAGWGVTEKNFTSPIKLYVTIPVWSDHSCKELYSLVYKLNLTSMQLCAGGLDGKDSCGGDSGGPLMGIFPNATHSYVEGIVSFGPRDCGALANPGVYIRVSEYVKWILDTIAP